MKRILPILMIPVLLVFLATGSAMAIDWTKNITIYDGSGTGDNWHGANEDQEVEPGMVGSQIWDLEGFIFENYLLTIVGGYDYYNFPGGFAPGDIFIDLADEYGEFGSLNVAYQQGSNGSVETTALGYDYVIDIDFIDQANPIYDVIDLTSSGATLSAHYADNKLSSPWQYKSGGTEVVGFQNQSFTYGKYTDGESGFIGDGEHHALSFDLSFLGYGEEFLAHFTMGCGNDNLMGRGNTPTAPVPEPATMLLLGTGLIGLAGLGRKKFFK